MNFLEIVGLLAMVLCVFGAAMWASGILVFEVKVSVGDEK